MNTLPTPPPFAVGDMVYYHKIQSPQFAMVGKVTGFVGDRVKVMFVEEGLYWPYNLVNLSKCKYRALVSVTYSSRLVSNFIVSAGLGISGVGTRTDIITIDYEQGEFVDRARVDASIKALIDLSEKEQSPFKIFSYAVINVLQLTTPDSPHSTT